MAYKYRLNILIRILILSSLIYALIFVLLKLNYIVLPIFIGFFILVSILELVFYSERSQKNLIQFLDAIKYKDYTKTYTSKGKRNSGIEGLNDRFNEITSIYRNLKIESESFYQYLLTVTKHVKIGIISYKENGDISLVNEAANSILRLPYLKNMDQIKKINPLIYQEIYALKSDEQKLIRLTKENQIIHLAIHVTSFILNEEKYNLVSLQNITSEINQTELTSWKNLIRVLTHEIMNSVTPMLSLNKAMKDTLVNSDHSLKDFKNITSVEAEDIFESLRLIEKRGSGLIDFVNSYKKITKIPKPVFVDVSIHDLIDDVLTLLSKDLLEIEINKDYSPAVKQFRIDPKLIEQVMINLIINASHAVSTQKNAMISIKTRFESSVIVEISDNGEGISSEKIDEIFIPFFTTKKEGSGIGLSLSQEIMRNHNGFISVHSVEGKGSTFTLSF